MFRLFLISIVLKQFCHGAAVVSEDGHSADYRRESSTPVKTNAPKADNATLLFREDTDSFGPSPNNDEVLFVREEPVFKDGVPVPTPTMKKRGYGLYPNGSLGDDDTFRIWIYGDQWCGNESLPGLYDSEGTLHDTDDSFTVGSYFDELTKASDPVRYQMVVQNIHRLWNQASQMKCNYGYDMSVKRDASPAPPSTSIPSLKKPSRRAFVETVQVVLFRVTFATGFAFIWQLGWNSYHDTPNARVSAVPGAINIGIAQTVTGVSEFLRLFGVIEITAALFLSIFASRAQQLSRDSIKDEEVKIDVCPSTSDVDAAGNAMMKEWEDFDDILRAEGLYTLKGDLGSRAESRRSLGDEWLCIPTEQDPTFGMESVTGHNGDETAADQTDRDAGADQTDQDPNDAGWQEIEELQGPSAQFRGNGGDSGNGGLWKGW